MQCVITKGSVHQQGDGSIRALFSTAAVDRMGDIIEQEGWELEAFRRNPVLLWSHDYAIPPVGKVSDLGVGPAGLQGVVTFAPTEHGKSVGKLYAEGFLGAFSVGFKPLEAEPRKGTKGYIYKRSELLEISAVSIPANSDALVVGRSGKPFTERYQNITRLLLGEPKPEAAPSWGRVDPAQRVSDKALAAIEKAEPWRRLQLLKLSLDALHEANTAMRESFRWAKHEHAERSLQACVELAKGWEG